MKSQGSSQMDMRFNCEIAQYVRTALWTISIWFDGLDHRQLWWYLKRTNSTSLDWVSLLWVFATMNSEPGIPKVVSLRQICNAFVQPLLYKFHMHTLHTLAAIAATGRISMRKWGKPRQKETRKRDNGKNEIIMRLNSGGKGKATRYKREAVLRPFASILINENTTDLLALLNRFI